MLDSAPVSAEKNSVIDRPQQDNSSVPAERSNSEYFAAVGSAGANTFQTYRNTTSGAEVQAIQLGSGTHGWAGSTVDAENIPGMGQPNQTVDASDLISDFFLEHPIGK